MAGYNIPDTFNQKDSLRSRGKGTGGPSAGAGGASSSTGAKAGGSRGSARDLFAQLGRSPGPNRGMQSMPIGRTPKAAPAPMVPTRARSMPPKATLPGPAKEVQSFPQGPRGPRRGS